MDDVLTCPDCHSTGLDVRSYESMMVLMPTQALFTVRCPLCGARVSCIRKIPDDMREEVQFAAIQVGAGMGQH